MHMSRRAGPMYMWYACMHTEISWCVRFLECNCGLLNISSGVHTEHAYIDNQ